MRLQATIIILLMVSTLDVFGQTVGNNNSYPSGSSSASAYLGSNTVTTAAYKFYIGGSIKSFNTGSSGINSPSIYLSNITATNGRNYFINSDPNGFFRIVDSNANAARFVIDNNGTICLSVTTPRAMLHLAAGSAT